MSRVVRYQGIPKLLPLSVLAFQILGKYVERTSDGTLLSRSSHALRAASTEAKSGFRLTISGAVFAATAVKILLSIADQGTSTQLTFTPGFSFWKVSIALLK